MIALLRDIATSVLDNGFDAILFLNGHCGNMSLIGTAVTKIGQEFPTAQVLGLTYFQLAEPFIDEIRESATGGMAHGGEFETSLMLHLRPELVQTDRAEATSMEDPYELRGEDLFEGARSRFIGRLRSTRSRALSVTRISPPPRKGTNYTDASARNWRFSY